MSGLQVHSGRSVEYNGPEGRAESGSLCEAFQATAARLGPGIALRTADGGTEITWERYADRVRAIAAGLASLGVRRGDTVGLLMANRPEFHLCDTAAIHLGATPFSLYGTSSVEQISYLFENAGNDVVFADAAAVPRVLAAAVRPSHVVCVDDDAPAGTMSLAELEARGAATEFDFEAAWRAVGPDDVLTLIYTSGTTGPPKGVQITHANMLAQCRAVAQVLSIRPGDRITSYLPSAHIADRWSAHYNSMMFGVQVTCVPDARAIAAALPSVRPTIWGGVPRVMEKLKAALEAQGITDPAALPEEHKAAVRAKLGLDEARWIMVGAAPLARDVHEYLLALGLPVLELFGMSECSCVVTVTSAEDVKVGTVGRAIPGLETRLAPDGELLLRGPTITPGYRGQPELTAEAIDPDGWLHTGDIAEIDDAGYVRIVDRKKELIINAGGKNMSPANIEQQLKAGSPLIGQACVIGDRRPYNVALLVLDPDALASWPADDVHDEVVRGVERANAKLSRVEQIKRYELIAEEWLPGGAELTPTMKLKRKPIAEKYAATIERLYA
jgi:long-subunit acyl-CoA synthetase (AMP-forming)